MRRGLIALTSLGSALFLGSHLSSRAKKNKLKEQREKAHTNLRGNQNLALSKLAEDMRLTRESPEYYQEQAQKALAEIEASYKKDYSSCTSLEEFYPYAERYPYNEFTRAYLANRKSDAMEYVSASVEFQRQIALLLMASCLDKNNPAGQCAKQYQLDMRNLSIWKEKKCAQVESETPKFTLE